MTRRSNTRPEIRAVFQVNPVDGGAPYDLVARISDFGDAKRFEFVLPAGKSKADLVADAPDVSRLLAFDREMTHGSTWTPMNDIVGRIRVNDVVGAVRESRGVADPEFLRDMAAEYPQILAERRRKIEEKLIRKRDSLPNRLNRMRQRADAAWEENDRNTARQIEADIVDGRSRLRALQNEATLKSGVEVYGEADAETVVRKNISRHCAAGWKAELAWAERTIASAAAAADPPAYGMERQPAMAM